MRTLTNSYLLLDFCMAVRKKLKLTAPIESKGIGSMALELSLKTNGPCPTEPINKESYKV